MNSINLILPDEGQDIYFRPKDCGFGYNQEFPAKFLEGCFVCGQEAFSLEEVRYWRAEDKGEKHNINIHRGKFCMLSEAEKKLRKDRNHNIAQEKWRAKQPKKAKPKQTEEELKAKKAEYAKVWREKNKEKHNEYLLKWQAENKDKVNAYAKNRRSNKKAAKTAGTV